jgi:glycine/D-amino acid oxidase-like deaminating enzyme
VVRIAVIGAGVFGAWSALRLAEAGHRVCLIDQYGPASGRASSADLSRVIRAGYGADAIYSEWARRALDDWRALEADTGERLLTITGAVFLGPPGFPYLVDTFETLARLQQPVEWIAAAELSGRFPGLAADGVGPAVFEPGAGVLRARPAVLAVVRHAVAAHGVTYTCAAVQPVNESRAAITVKTSSGALVDADFYVFACGPWLPTLFPEAVGARIRPTRQEVLYFGLPPGTHQFAVPHFPVWIDFDAGLYGLPDLDSAGFKVGIDRHGPSIDPDTADRIVDAALIDSTRTFLARRFPRLAAAPLVDARVCQYENTATGDFLIDRHPRYDNVYLVGGGSGHGFKHGPSVARHVVDLIDGRVPVAPRFALATKGIGAQRAVH